MFLIVDEIIGVYMSSNDSMVSTVGLPAAALMSALDIATIVGCR